MVMGIYLRAKKVLMDPAASEEIKLTMNFAMIAIEEMGQRRIMRAIESLETLID